MEQVDLGVALDVCADIDFVGHLCGAQLAQYDWRARWPLARRNTHAPSWLQKIPRAAEVHSIPHLQRHHSPGQCVRRLVACCPSLSAARPCLGRMHGDPHTASTFKRQQRGFETHARAASVVVRVLGGGSIRSLPNHAVGGFGSTVS